MEQNPQQGAITMADHVARLPEKLTGSTLEKARQVMQVEIDAGYSDVRDWIELAQAEALTRIADVLEKMVLVADPKMQEQFNAWRKRMGYES